MGITSNTFSLNTGDKIPALGLGTWQSKPNEVAKAVEVALRKGYRHIDTAAAYGNEAEVGAGIKASGVPRKDIWITTKLNNPDHKRVAAALDDSLSKLGVDYIDLYLMHWPSSTDPSDTTKIYTDWDFTNTWAEMQKLPATGKVKNIGVSNFVEKNLQKLFSSPDFKITPAVNQIELHPNNPSPKLVEFNSSRGIHSTGYSCLGSTDSPLFKSDKLLNIAKRHGKTPQQVLLVWGHKKGWSVIPKSVTPERIEANFEIDDFDLTNEDMKVIDGVQERIKVCNGGFLPADVKVFFGDDEADGKGFVQS